MARPLATASAAWTVAILAATAGVLLPGDEVRVSLALFAFAVGLALIVASVLVADGVRRRRARTRAAAEAAVATLGRLEYLPSVTTGTRRTSWRGSPYRTIRVRGEGGAEPTAIPLQGTAQPSGALPETFAASAAG